MTDSEYSKHKRRIQKLADRWLNCLGLKWWAIDINYEREGIPVSPTDAAVNWECNARVRAKWEYLKAAIDFNMLAVARLTDEELERTFVHECCHVLVAEMREWGPGDMTQAAVDISLKHEERVVCGLTSALLWTRRDGAGKLRRNRKKAKTA